MRGKANIIKRLEKERDKLGIRRDALRDLADEVDALFESACDGIDLLNEAIERLSEYA
jgi:hypothetical protein